MSKIMTEGKEFGGQVAYAADVNYSNKKSELEASNVQNAIDEVAVDTKKNTDDITQLKNTTTLKPLFEFYNKNATIPLSDVSFEIPSEFTEIFVVWWHPTGVSLHDVIPEKMINNLYYSAFIACNFIRPQGSSYLQFSKSGNTITASAMVYDGGQTWNKFNGIGIYYR